MKICLGLPNGGRMLSRFFTDLPQWMQSVPGASFVPVGPEGSIGPHNRWIAARVAVEQNCDYLWLIDADMAIAADTLPRLLAHDKQIVGAAYNYRSLPSRTVVKMRNPRGELYIPDTIPTEPFVCAAIGSGCKLIKVSALDEIPQPWFALEWDADGCLIKTDDIWFCEQALSVGIQTWCDPTLDVKHVGDFSY